jgi:uncharacterized protein (DUF1330 family)
MKSIFRIFILQLLTMLVFTSAAFSQSKPAYLISEVTITDKENYTKLYMPESRKVWAKYDAVFLVRQGAPISLSGDKPAPGVSVLKLSSMAKAQEMASSEEFKKIREIAKPYAVIRSYIVEGGESK